MGLLSVESLLSVLSKKERLSISKLITHLESRTDKVPEIVKNIFPKTGKATILGITGPPGSGKSTLTAGLVSLFRKEKKTVAVLAVDPSSPFSGGAILGDRIRMLEHSLDKNVYIRSMGTRGSHGGLAQYTREAVMLLDAAGFDVIIVETAGVGQTELEIMNLAQTIVVVLVPESGDSIQVMKAGLMEIADVFVVNKCDRPQADSLEKELIEMLGQTCTNEKKWIVPVTKTQADAKKGLDAVFRGIKKHQEYLDQTGLRKEKEKKFLHDEVVEIVTEKLRATLRDNLDQPLGKKLLDDLAARNIDPYEAAKKLSS